MTMVRLLARPMLAAPFVMRGVQAFLDPDPMVPGSEPIAAKVAPLLQKISPKAPSDTRTLVRMNSAIQVGAGSALAAGVAPRLSATVLAASLVPATLAEHPFWTMQDKVARREHRGAFLTDLGLLGGLLVAAVDTEGKPGMPWRAKRAARDAERSARTAKREAKLAARSAKAQARLAAREAKDAALSSVSGIGA